MNKERLKDVRVWADSRKGGEASRKLNDILKRMRGTTVAGSKYNLAIEEFDAFCLSSLLPTSTTADLDSALARYCVDLYFKGKCIAAARTVVCAVRWSMCLTDAMMPRALLSLKGFRKPAVGNYSRSLSSVLSNNKRRLRRGGASQADSSKRIGFSENRHPVDID